MLWLVESSSSTTPSLPISGRSAPSQLQQPLISILKPSAHQLEFPPALDPLPEFQNCQSLCPGQEGCHSTQADILHKTWTGLFLINRARATLPLPGQEAGCHSTDILHKTWTGSLSLLLKNLTPSLWLQVEWRWLAWLGECMWWWLPSWQSAI